MSYYFSKTVKGKSFDEAVAHVTEELKKEGFGVLTEVDVKSTFKHKLNVDFRRYVILGACNPHLAYKAIEVDPHMGLLLPCNVVVQEDSAGSVMVSIADPRAMFSQVENADLTAVVDEADARLRRVFDAIAPAHRFSKH